MAALVGVVAGALIGHTVFRLLGTDATATALLRIDQPPNLVAVAGGASQSTPDTQENLRSYASGEVAYLSGSGFAQEVAEKLGKSEPADLDVMQDGETTVVTITSTALTASDAIRTVAAAVELYRTQLAQRTDQQLRVVLPVLDRWEQEAGPDRVQTIHGLRNSVMLQAASSGAAVLQTPTVNADTAHRATIGALLGALLAGSALPLVLMGRRRRAGVLSSDPEVAESVDGILIPAVNLRQGRRRNEDDTTLARTLWAQLPDAPGVDRIVVVLGASSASGAARVSTLLSSAAAENGPVTTISLGDAADESLVLDSCAGSAVVDAGALGGSPLVPRVLGTATCVVLVGRLGVDTVTQVLAVRAATASLAVPLVAAFTYRPWWSFGPTQRDSPAEPARADA
ncbi:hypothetical protein [Mycolicibacterium baixiangningiae]|uniref:hypothetical protein n=1 Tax=Mycolicibacterium baixiangningiae TaxID=2761578 RepID=UPI001867868E|nr:hypothetical protein [Mycolicibacterium baixiangningiae]